MKKLKTLCTPCGKPRDEGCSHIDCPNRKPVTAAFTGTRDPFNSSASRKLPNIPND